MEWTEVTARHHTKDKVFHFTVKWYQPGSSDQGFSTTGVKPCSHGDITSTAPASAAANHCDHGPVNIPLSGPLTFAFIIAECTLQDSQWVSVCAGSGRSSWTGGPDLSGCEENRAELSHIQNPNRFRRS